MGTRRHRPLRTSPPRFTEHQHPTNAIRDHGRQPFLDQQLTLDRQRAELRQPTEEVEQLLRCQREFFDHLEHPDPTQDFDAQLELALRVTGTGPIETKRLLRRWALHHHIAEVLRKVRDPARRWEVLHEQMTALLSFRYEDGLDNTWVLEGFELFSAAIEKVGLDIAHADPAESQGEPRGVAAGRRQVPSAGQRVAGSAQGRSAPESTKPSSFASRSPRKRK
jgi:hypothetical protein